MIKNLTFFFILSSYVSLAQQREIWIVPNKYNLNQGDTLILNFGITGYGPLDPINLKILAYSEARTLIKHGNEPAQYNIYAIVKNSAAPKDRFTKKYSGVNPVLLESDLNSNFDQLLLIPETNGDKRLLLVATYSPDGISWYTTSRELEYHVNSFTEEYETHFTILVVMLGILALRFDPIRKWFKKHPLKIIGTILVIAGVGIKILSAIAIDSAKSSIIIGAILIVLIWLPWQKLFKKRKFQ